MCVVKSSIRISSFHKTMYTFKLLTFNIQIDFIIVDSSLEILGTYV